ncbi:N-acetylglutamate synthase-like GNAT family acetyltransferase [Metabacillus crassostreae]|uniref:GNAT family N-acetyltransferase n=1 Tax=Metabacillus crassostreae TaxID=929098 RepID=UPI00195EBF3E|nr:GNAT family N-acetyltransferase [Metabacillus crassostreae]MBM7605889.1 N-acetylglutamate synthase-like GNAT family acetyltransferase [Metabacillus crassostreae]
MITYKVNDVINADELAEVFKLSGIKRPVEDLPRLQKMIEHADIIITAREEGKVIGVARAITDYHYCCYLSDLAISKDYQGKGIGKKLVALLKEELGEKVSLILLASEEAMEYYPKIGFDTIDNGFKIGRKS